VVHKLRADSRAIIEACLQAVDPEEAVKRFVSLDGDDFVVADTLRLPLRDLDRIFVVGAGKGTAPMAKALESILGDRIADGAICVKYGHGLGLQRIRVFEGGHPLPDASGQRATLEIMDLVRHAGSRDLVISCISGGGLRCCPLRRRR